MKQEVLIIDDNFDIRNLVSNILKDKNYDIREAANFDQAVNEIEKKLPDLAIIDVKLDKGDKDGIDLLKKIKKMSDLVPVIVISGHANVEMAVEALKLGAYEFITKPFATEQLLNFVNRALENIKLKKENKQLENKLFHSFELVGESNQVTKIKKMINKLSSTDSRVLIYGPTGSGKELVARRIHKNSPRSKDPFIVLNGALLQPDNYEQELFGTENRDGTISYGFLEKTKNGTLLIDEVSEIPLDTQAKILRVLIDQKFKRINGNKDVHVNIRIISSTSKDLKNEVAIGNFREDLYHRLNVVPIEIPKLSSRTADIPLLIKYFQKKISEINGIPEIDIDTNDELLYSYDWPGNVRELRNLVERISILSQNENKSNIGRFLNEILSKNSSDSLQDSSVSLSFPLKQARENFEKSYLLNQLKKNKGNVSKTAEFIGMERSALHRKLKSLGIKGIN
ncbi:MAG: sigma-54-dependent Fis family transcriptional regulator [Candidatus Marinimicrobia bacterium]|nr:sigma-54-dependent Fis family transcriptional regulator [Candidatus Neomarinimicrobiota bacterium]RPG05876.1 MAG: sigma-54-dependent Fis family transcriptional regulator [Pelagibacteraceae bacterium TMED247]